MTTRGDSTRGRILQAAIDLFHQYGYNGTSVQDVVSKAKVPKGSFYNHFKSKEELAIAASDAFYPMLLSFLEVENTSSPTARLRKYFRLILKQMQRYDYLRGCMVGTFALEFTDATPALRKRTSYNGFFWDTRPTSDEAIDTGRLESAPVNSGRNDDRLCVQRIATIEPNRLRAIGLRNDPFDLSVKHQFGSKLNRLPERALAEVVSEDAIAEAEVVFNARRCASLTARRPCGSTNKTLRPSEAPYTAVASPAGLPPTITTS